MTTDPATITVELDDLAALLDEAQRRANGLAARGYLTKDIAPTLGQAIVRIAVVREHVVVALGSAGRAA